MNIPNELETNGVCVIPIFNQEECNLMIQDMWKMLADLTKTMQVPISEHDKKTWKTLYDLFPKHAMLLQHWGVGHSQFAWNVRQHPKVLNEFAKLWNVNSTDLITSFDGVSVHFPPEVTNRGWFKNNWLHCDQSFTRNKLECIQGFVSATHCKPEDATFCYLEGSHKLHKEFANTYNKLDKSDWYKLSDDEQAYFAKKGCVMKRLEVPAGSLVLWDSRLIHSGVEPLKTRACQNLRCVVYVCMVPRILSSEKNQKKRQKAFSELRMTTHWPMNTKLFPKHPHTYGNPLPNVDVLEMPVLSNLGEKLV